MFVEMDKLALEPNEILETHLYVIEGIETPADQGFYDSYELP